MEKIYIVKWLEYKKWEDYKHAVNYKAFTTKDKAQKRLTSELERLKSSHSIYIHGNYVKKDSTGEIIEFYIESIILE